MDQIEIGGIGFTREALLAFLSAAHGEVPPEEIFVQIGGSATTSMQGVAISPAEAARDYEMFVEGEGPLPPYINEVMIGILSQRS